MRTGGQGRCGSARTAGLVVLHGAVSVGTQKPSLPFVDRETS